MMKTILVPVDFSFVSARTIETATMLARATQSSLTFVHIVQENLFFDGMGIPVANTEDNTDAMVFEARRSLNSYVSTAVSSGLSASAFVLRGHPANRILEKAAELKPGFIVMGSHGHGSIHHLLAGSTAQGVLKRVDCPIVLVPPRYAETFGNAAEKEATVS